jgi:tetratricopeptide (TPR) repeat protein
MGPSDPLCYNEMGVWSYKKREYAEAAQWLHAALRIFASRSMPNGSAVRLLTSEDPSDAAVYNGEEMLASTPAVEGKLAGRGNQAMQPPLTSVKIGADVDTSALHDDMSVIGSSHIKTSPPGNNKGQELSDRECIDLCQDSFWEPTIFNLGQSYRKMRLFEEATVCFEKCLSLCPVRTKILISWFSLDDCLAIIFCEKVRYCC